ncbi:MULTISPECIES: type II secretion system protein GspE [Photorhabdus]|uniref:Type II secretion system protein GspE n=2 Tax=Photorhabdus TaxID=29487 RepID=A0ABX0B585_9GAMM|nr:MULTISPECIES: type II secretion system protein GspE [Photorhabdus]MCC8373078.1 type II secretion system protein GspE [Photorhabdus bodei]MCC8463036.1 type II secretion system protein GspE [Photorhabdus bodei]MCT8351583.1 type II secretion system protein GspE [Photorhabdus kayaii]MDB6367335.1 type II secretion system protein GspE [Photorhabdus bodei]MDB6372769.1 type II secretion system protein GspE [Photorhabdus bodei]
MNSLSATENTLMEKEIHDICQRHQSVVIKKDDNTITIASSELPNDDLLSALRFISGCIVNVEIWPLARIESVLHQNISLSHAPEEESSLLPLKADINTDENDAPVIQLINQTLLTAIQRRASDIHFEPFQQGYRIRIRVDGALHLLSSPSHQMNASIAARLKIMAKLNIAEKRLPQDGQFDWSDTRHNYAIRMATLPTIHGEKVVLRILNTMQQLSLDQLGIPDPLLNQLRQKLALPQGMILVTGPTGSGKTVTLYSCLQYLDQNKKNICSVEDPVEIPLNGINQTQTNSKIELNFAKVLRALLRQDPDVIMVGEIRDGETAEISVKAAQTGHLVLSTLHTNSTIDTLSRLQNLGISGYMAASCIKLIIAQRLVRKLCLHCRKQQTEETIINIENNSLFIKQWLAVGCEHCFSGYYGRTAIYEFLEITYDIQQILSEQNPKNVQKTIMAQRKDTLLSSGILLVEQGITTLEEIYQVTGQE